MFTLHVCSPKNLVVVTAGRPASIAQDFPNRGYANQILTGASTGSIAASIEKRKLSGRNFPPTREFVMLRPSTCQDRWAAERDSPVRRKSLSKALYVNLLNL
jgi:hypothetical protein